MMITQKQLNHIRGKSFRELIGMAGRRAVFKGRRFVNLVREGRCLGWVPSERYIMGRLNKEIQNKNRNFAHIFPLWEARFRRVFLPGANEKFKKTFEREYPRERELICEVATNVAKGKFVLFREYIVDLGPNIDWHTTIINENTWPVIYFRKIDIRNSAKTGDLRTTWELNRHIHWVTLGKAYFLTGKNQFFATFWQHFESWTKNNPYLLGVNWLSAMEVAIRLNHWFATYTLFCDCPHFHNAAKIKFWRWVFLHVHFLRYHFTWEDRGFRNNHLIMEAASLYIVGALLSEFKDSIVWRNKGERVLTEELQIQFFRDGFHKELCSSYHLQVTDAYLLTAVVAKRRGLQLAKQWRQHIHKIVKALCIIAKPDGNLPMLGDGDDGTFLCLSIDRKQMNVKTVTDIASNLLQKQDFAIIDNHLSEGAFWFLGPAILPIPQKRREHSCILSEAQFAVFKDTGQKEYKYCLFSAGTKNPFQNYGHRHADLLGVTLSLFGADVLLDPGTYCYNGPFEWRRYFQNTHNHNTIVLNGRSQFDFKDRHFGIERITYYSELKTFTGRGSHIFRGKYIDVERGVWHCRYLVVLPHFMIIHDFCGEGVCSNAVLNFTFAKGVSLIPHNDQIMCHFAENRKIVIDLFSGDRSFREAGELRKKWLSDSYWTKQKCQSLSMSSIGSYNCFTTIINSSMKGSYKRRYIRGRNGHSQEVIHIEGRDGEVNINFSDTLDSCEHGFYPKRWSSSFCVTEVGTSDLIKFDVKADRFVRIAKGGACGRGV